MLSHPPIPIADMAEHTERLKANDSLKLSQEYEVSGPLPPTLPGPTDAHPDTSRLPFPSVHRPGPAVHMGALQPGSEQAQEPLCQRYRLRPLSRHPPAY